LAGIQGIIMVMEGSNSDVEALNDTWTASIKVSSGVGPRLKACSLQRDMGVVRARARVCVCVGCVWVCKMKHVLSDIHKYSANLLNLDVDVNDRCGGIEGKAFVWLTGAFLSCKIEPQWRKVAYLVMCFFSHCQKQS